MKRFASIFALVALVAVSGAWACDQHQTANAADEKGSGATKDVSLTGYLTDSYCGAANANAKGKSCAVECIKKGAKVQLVSNDKTYTLEKAASVESLIGVPVKVTGSLDETTSVITVRSIEEVKQS